MIVDILNTFKTFVETETNETCYKMIMPEYNDQSNDIGYCLRLLSFAGHAKRKSCVLQMKCRYKITGEFTEEFACQDAYDIWGRLMRQHSLRGCGIESEGDATTSITHDPQQLYYIYFNIKIIFS